MTANLTRLNIEVTARCNLNCTMCVRSVWQEGLGDMSMETYRRLVPVFPEIDAVNLSGIGEPLLNKNLLEMMRLAKGHLPSAGIVSFTTNATMIDKATAQELVSSGLDDVVISVDGATADTFKEIRRGAKLDDVLEGVRLLVQAKERLGSQTPRIGFEFVAQKKNVPELPALVELAAEQQASFVIVSHVLPHSEEMNKQILYGFNSDEAMEIFNEVKAEAKSRNLTLSYYPDFIPHIHSFFGMPPLRGASPVSHHIERSTSDEKQQVLQLLEKATAKALKQDVVLNFTKLLSPNGVDLDHTVEIFRQAQARAQQHNIALDLPPLIPKTRRECGFIKNGICFISWDGYVRPCNNLNHSYKCYINDRPKSITSVSFGNVLKQDLKAIWHSEDYRRFRELVNKFDFAPCGDCNFADACYVLHVPVFPKDCYNYTQPCGDCPWARGILKCF